MTRPRLLEDLKSATADLAHARQSLEDAKFMTRNCMANDIAFATHVEHTVYHRWLRASAAINSVR